MRLGQDSTCVRGRQAFRATDDAARSFADAAMLARAALGFAGGRLALRMISRLTYLLAFIEDDEVMPPLARRAEELDWRLGDAESEVLSGGRAVIPPRQPLWCPALLISTFLTVIVGVKPSVGQRLASAVILPCSVTLLPSAGEVGSTPWWNLILAAASVKA